MNVMTADLRSRFAAALSRMYGAEVPAYTTLVDVSTEVNRDHRRDDGLGSLARVTWITTGPAVVSSLTR